MAKKKWPQDTRVMPETNPTDPISAAKKNLEKFLVEKYPNIEGMNVSVVGNALQIERLLHQSVGNKTKLDEKFKSDLSKMGIYIDQVMPATSWEGASGVYQQIAIINNVDAIKAFAKGNFSLSSVSENALRTAKVPPPIPPKPKTITPPQRAKQASWEKDIEKELSAMQKLGGNLNKPAKAVPPPVPPKPERLKQGMPHQAPIRKNSAGMVAPTPPPKPLKSTLPKQPTAAQTAKLNTSKQKLDAVIKEWEKFQEEVNRLSNSEKKLVNTKKIEKINFALSTLNGLFASFNRNPSDDMLNKIIQTTAKGVSLTEARMRAIRNEIHDIKNMYGPAESVISPQQHQQILERLRQAVKVDASQPPSPPSAPKIASPTSEGAQPLHKKEVSVKKKEFHVSDVIGKAKNLKSTEKSRDIQPSKELPGMFAGAKMAVNLDAGKNNQFDASFRKFEDLKFGTNYENAYDVLGLNPRELMRESPEVANEKIAAAKKELIQSKPKDKEIIESASQLLSKEESRKEYNQAADIVVNTIRMQRT